jgi:predicted RND superfamily exporter protein
MPGADAEPLAADRGAALAERYVAWLVRHAGVILLASVALCALSALSLLRLRLDVDLLSMLPQGRPRFADYQRYVARFGAQDVAVAVIRAPDATQAIRFAGAFEEEIAKLPEVQGVRSRVDLAAFATALHEGALARLLPLETHAEIARRLTPDAIDGAVRGLRTALAAPGSVGTATYLAADPLGLDRLLAESLAHSRPDRALAPGSEYLLSPDGRRLLLLIRPAETGYDIEASQRLADALAGAAARAHQSSGVGEAVEVGYTGAFAFAIEDASLLRTDMAIYSALALAGVLAVFLIGYRSLEILPLITWQIVLGTLVTFALGLLVEGQLNAVSLAFAVIFYGLGIDAAIHFYTRFLEEWGGDGTIDAPLARTVRGLLPATVVAATTSAVGFVVIAFSDFAGVAQLGALTGLGMVLNVPATFLLLPAQIAWTHRHTRWLRAGHQLAETDRLAALAAAASRHRRTLLVVGVVGLLAACVPARHATLDTDLFNLRPRHSTAADVQAELEREFGLVDPPGAVLIEAARGDDPMLDEALLQVVERVDGALQEARSDGGVETVLSPAPLLPSLATQRARLASWAKLPRDAAATILERRLTESGFRLEPFRDALAALRAVPEPIDPTLASLPGLELLFERQVRRDAQGLAVLIPFRPRDEAVLEDLAVRLPAAATRDGVSVTVTGRPLMEAELHRTMRGEMAWFLIAVALGNALLIWVRVRDTSVTLAIVGVPSVVVLLLLAILGATGAEINAVNLIVFPLTIGLGVDNCVYLAERCRELGSMRAAVASTGRPLTITAATTAVGFGVLALSRYPAMSALGWLAATSIVLCLIATVVLLPMVLPRRWYASQQSDG